MATMKTTRTIKAPVDQVFDNIAHIENFSKAIPHITNVEMLSDESRGLGTRFKETRVMNGRESTTELEVAEYVENERVRMVADQGGTVWDTLFTLKETGGETELHMVMEAKPHKLMARIVTPLIKGVVQKAVEQDMDAVKAYCEQQGQGS